MPSEKVASIETMKKAVDEFDGTNWRDFAFQVRTTLRSNGCWHTIDPGTAPDEDTAADVKADWELRNDRAFGVISLSCVKQVRNKLHKIRLAKDAWDVLVKEYVRKSVPAILALKDQRDELLKKPGASMRDWIAGPVFVGPQCARLSTPPRHTRVHLRHSPPHSPHSVDESSGPVRCTKCAKEGHNAEEHTSLSSNCPAKLYYSRRARAVVYYRGADPVRAAESAKRAAELRVQERAKTAAARKAAAAPDADGFITARTRAGRRRQQEQEAAAAAQSGASTSAEPAGDGGAPALMRPRQQPPTSSMLRGRGGRNRNRGGQQKGGVIRLLQANVGRSGPRTDALLRRADEEHIDIVLVQEPGGYWAPGKECSRTSKSYQALLPDEGSGTRPRVVTYVRKTGLQWTTSLRQD
ncbi:hypothetical protein CF326_g5900, partial [Tilletia indica]